MTGSVETVAVRRTGRWRGIVAVALLAGAVGVLTARSQVLLLAVVGVAYAAFPRVTGRPTPSLRVERTLADGTPRRGDEVEVTVTVTNTGRWPLFDVRLVDGVPAMLAVRSGTPRHAAVLLPGRSTTFAYAVGAEYGRHQFDPATVFLRDASGGLEVEARVPADPPTVLTCTDAVPEVPLRRQTRLDAGRLVTDDGGSGIEFHRTREYRRGDPMSRIDWKRLARSGDLTTVEFREERAASVVLLVDARAAAYRASEAGAPHGVAYALAGAEQLLTALSDTRDYVGLAALGREFCWLPAGTGAEHERTARDLLATHPTLSPRPPETDEGVDGQLEELEKRLPRDAQVVFLSPLVDEFAASAALSLEATGHAVTVVSPEVASSSTVGGRLARVARANRIHSLREAEIPVVDWDPEEPLGTAVVRIQEVTA
ncbi:DUF58 domain-containing protein [Halomarina ordinaria]|uniref:DUF58 domain-containing protein n=1 Tax=Halomarina ordinaria TaxID=3033939 RepID=A0ABD5UD05_9EURY|nr:DUF58 domain-containing protein [Halomarina sp. PSRA2]